MSGSNFWFLMCAVFGLICLNVMWFSFLGAIAPRAWAVVFVMTILNLCIAFGIGIVVERSMK